MEKHKVYALIKNSKCVYVGCTSNIKNRLSKHKSDKDFDTHVVIKSYKKRKDALLAENSIIRFLGFFHDQYTLNSLNLIDVCKMEWIKEVYE